MTLGTQQHQLGTLKAAGDSGFAEEKPFWLFGGRGLVLRPGEIEILQVGVARQGER